MAKATFSFDHPEDSPGLLLWQTTVIWQRLIKKELDAYNVSHAQFVILATILWFENKKEEISQGLIIRQSRLDKMTVSKSLKKLSIEKLITRNEHQKDMRAKSVSLTAKGKILVEKLVLLVESIDHDFFSVVNKKDQFALIQFLRRLSSNE